MIKGVHAMFYASHAEELRVFIRDKLGLPFTDVGEGWLIFDVPEADMGVHPTDGKTAAAGTHSISLYCDDIEGTVAGLTSRGVEFTKPVTDAGYGLTTLMKMPGGVVVELYEPHYAKRSGR